jgi:TatD DNase family protein
MYLIDTHSHLYLPDFDSDIDEVVHRALASGVQKIILPNIDSASITKLQNLVTAYNNVFMPLMGLHPTHVKNNYKDELEIISQQLESYVYKGIGEIGVDLYWDKSYLNEQIIAFEMQLAIAIQKNLPVVIHARESFDEIFRSVTKPEFIGLRGIFHAFTGNIEQAQYIIKLGLKLGIGGMLTYKNSSLVQVIENVGLEHLVLETDSPYLPPVPYRGKRNESSYVVKVAEKIAELKNIDVSEVAEITTKNAREIFGI